MIAIYLAGDSVLTIHAVELLDNEVSVLQLLTICGVVLGSAQSYIPNPATSTTDGNTIDDPNKILDEIGRYTHNIPLSWKHRGHTPEVYRAVCSMFKSPISCFLDDLVSIVLTPYVLWFQIAPRSELIVTIICNLMQRNERLGDVCGPSTFGSKGQYIKSEVFRTAPSVLEEGGRRIEGPGRIMESWSALPGNATLTELSQSWNDPGDKMKMSYENFREQHGRCT